MRSSAWPRQRREGPFVRSADTAASAHRRKTSAGVFITPCVRLDTLAAEKEAPFISNFFSELSVQKTLIYCSSIYTSSTGTIVSVHADVTNTVNMWSQDWTCGQTKAPRSSRHDISSILAGRIVLAGALYVFQDRKPAACSSPDRQRGACLYLREVIPLIYIKHQRKAPAPTPPQPSWCDPLQKRLGTLCWPHMHTRDQKQNKQWPFKYQPTCPLFRWRSYCTFLPVKFKNMDATTKMELPLWYYVNNSELFTEWFCWKKYFIS